jgi:hypothetical protein
MNRRFHQLVGFARQARRLFLLGAAFLLCLSGHGLAAADSATAKEYQVKAAFVFQFMQFVEWPRDTFADPETPMRIGILGTDPFGQALDEVVRGETVQGRKVEVVRARTMAELTGCQLVFLPQTERREVSEMLSVVGSRPVLTVGETKDFAEKGGVINFFTDEKKIRFEINPDAAERSGLKISSKLLRLGKIVRSGPGKGAP